MEGMQENMAHGKAFQEWQGEGGKKKKKSIVIDIQSLLNALENVKWHLYSTYIAVLSIFHIQIVCE